MTTSSRARSGRSRGQWLVQAERTCRAHAAGALAACALFLSACSAPVPKDNAAESTEGVATQRGDAARGLALVTAFRDSLPANSGNALRCTSCHLDNGTRATALPWLGTAARYPRYRSRRGSEESLPQRVNDCIARSLAGQTIPEDGRDMRDIIAYLNSLGTQPRPATPDSIRLVGHVAEGKAVWSASCARCHGASGEGMVAPPMWGENSFAVSAGMARQIMFASFVRANMPYDRMGTTTPQQAADVAAYVLSQPRQDHPGKEKDWPKGDPPSDVAYATDSARKAGKPMPPVRPLLPRRVPPTPPAQRASGN